MELSTHIATLKAGAGGGLLGQVTLLQLRCAIESDAGC